MDNPIHPQARRGHVEGVGGYSPETPHAFIAICFPLNVGKVGFMVCQLYFKYTMEVLCMYIRLVLARTSRCFKRTPRKGLRLEMHVPIHFQTSKLDHQVPSRSEAFTRLLHFIELL